MKRFKLILRRLLFPGTAVALGSVPVAAALLLYVFLADGSKTPVAYLAYAFSAWSLTVVCTSLLPAVGRGGGLVKQNRYVRRYLTDIPFKTKVTLYGSLGVNVLYAGLKLASGIYYGSVWFITLAVYYGFLAVLRFLLLRHVNRNTVGKNLLSEWKRNRLCGLLLILMNIALGGMTVLVIRQNRSFEYAGHLIYVMALYAFYAVITAVINLIKYRKLGSPVLSAAKTISLAAALVSMLALETAMLTQFGGADDMAFRHVMTAATGAAVCLAVLGMAVYMVMKSTKELNRLKHRAPGIGACPLKQPR